MKFLTYLSAIATIIIAVLYYVDKHYAEIYNINTFLKQKVNELIIKKETLERLNSGQRDLIDKLRRNKCKEIEADIILYSEFKNYCSESSNFKKQQLKLNKLNKLVNILESEKKLLQKEVSLCNNKLSSCRNTLNKTTTTIDENKLSAEEVNRRKWIKSLKNNKTDIIIE